MANKLIGSGKFIFLVLLLLAGSACSDGTFPLNQGEIGSNFAADRIKLLVGETGVYRVSASDLSAAGIDLGDGLAYESLRLSDAGVSVPFLIKDKALIFYGQVPDSRYYAQRPYMLQIGLAGEAIAGANLPASGGPELDQVRQTVRLEEDHNYVPDARQENSDVWFWSKISQQDQFTTEFSLPFAADGAAALRWNAWGATQNPDVENDHDFEILVNDIPAGTAVFDGQTFHTGEIILPPGILQSGPNSITLDNSKEGASFLDIVQVNWLEVEYPALPTAVNDRLDFTASAGRLVIENLSGSPVVLDIGDPARPLALAGWRFADGRLELAVPDGKRIAVVGRQGFLKPDLEAVHESSWADKTHQADLIIITADAEFAPALAPLVTAREAEGLSVVIVPVTDIYDEIGRGAPSPESIRDFVTHVYHNWQEPRSRYLLLVGDATSDYRGRLGETPENTLPSLMVPVHIGGETVSDSRLADVDDDQRPELAVGRWPVQTRREVADLVERTLAYEAGQAGKGVIFVTDGSEISFSRTARSILENGGIEADQVIQSDGPTSEEIGALWQTSPWLAAYLGHGSIDRWGKDDIFNLQELGKLKGDSVPIVLQLTCLSGLFASPEQVPLAESMLLHPSGPVLTVAASSLTFSYHQEPYAAAFLQHLQDRDVERIGDAFLGAKEVLDIENFEGLREINDTFALFGDPSAKISRP